MKAELSKIIGKEVQRLFLVVWPPYGESRIEQLDIAAGYVFKDTPASLLVISTDRNELTSPCISCEPVPKTHFDTEDFKGRVKKWIDCDPEMALATEYYDVTSDSRFSNIVGKRIQDVAVVWLSLGDAPIGVKVVFEDDYVLSTPITDGNTIETMMFHKTDNLAHYADMGTIEFRSVE